MTEAIRPPSPEATPSGGEEGEARAASERFRSTPPDGGVELHLRVLTEAGVALDEEAVSVVAHGELGYLGILRDHAPLVTTLSPGKLMWHSADGRASTRRLGGGFLEVLNNRITILTTSLEETAG